MIFLECVGIIVIQALICVHDNKVVDFFFFNKHSDVANVGFFHLGRLGNSQICSQNGIF